MFGRLKTGDIPALSSHAEALAHWESVKPIRGRRDDERPLGDRRKSDMKIARNLDTVICVLYETNVITFHPDNTITVCVPEQWRSTTTAQFISAVLRDKIKYTGLVDGDVVMSLDRISSGLFRIGEKTRFKLVPNGLELIEGNIVRNTHAVNRKVMNAARKSIGEYLTYQRGSHKVREGMYSSSEMGLLYEFLVKHKQLEASFPFDTFMSSNHSWTLHLPLTNRWVGRDMSITAWHERVKFALQMMRTGSHEDWYAVTLWLVASSYYLISNKNVHIEFEPLTKDVTDMLLVVTPGALVATPEPYGEIKVDGNRNAAAVKNSIAALEEKNT
jgi:hypothetical protein